MLLGYGEDFLTLRMLTDCREQFCKALGISQEYIYDVFYRCSFGRGGPPAFGEFDFILMENRSIYLGECKWDGRVRRSFESIQLADAQVRRHAVLSTYINFFYTGDRSSLANLEIVEPSKGTLLHQTLQAFERALKFNYPKEPPNIHHVLAYFYDENLLKDPRNPPLPEMSVPFSFGIGRDVVQFDKIPISYTTLLSNDAPFIRALTMK